MLIIHTNAYDVMLLQDYLFIKFIKLNIWFLFTINLKFL